MSYDESVPEYQLVLCRVLCGPDDRRASCSPALRERRQGIVLRLTCASQIYPEQIITYTLQPRTPCLMRKLSSQDGALDRLSTSLIGGSAEAGQASHTTAVGVAESCSGGESWPARGGTAARSVLVHPATSVPWYNADTDPSFAQAKAWLQQAWLPQGGFTCCSWDRRCDAGAGAGFGAGWGEQAGSTAWDGLQAGNDGAPDSNWRASADMLRRNALLVLCGGSDPHHELVNVAPIARSPLARRTKPPNVQSSTSNLTSPERSYPRRCLLPHNDAQPSSIHTGSTCSPTGTTKRRAIIAVTVISATVALLIGSKKLPSP